MDMGKEEEHGMKKGDVTGRGKAPGLAVRGDEGFRGEETGVPGVGVLD